MGNCICTRDPPSSSPQRIPSSATHEDSTQHGQEEDVNVESETLASLAQLKNQIDIGNVQPKDVIHRLHLFISRLQQGNSTTEEDEGGKGAFDKMVDNVIQKWEKFSDTGIPQAVAKVTAELLEKIGDTSYMLVGLSLIGSMLTTALDVPKNTDACNKFMKCLSCLLAILDSHLSKTSNSPLSIERVATMMNEGIVVCLKYTSSSFGRRFVDAQALQRELDEISERLRNAIQDLGLETQFNTYYKIEQIDQRLEQLDRKFDRSRTVWYNRNQDAEDDQSTVGIKQRVEDVKKLLAIGEKDMKGSAVILYGQGGIGKTTLASKVIKSLQSDPSFGFVCACIELDTYRQDLVSQVHQLQEYLIQQLSKDNQKGKVSEKIFGQDKLRQLFKAQSCFIFINNVARAEQLEGLLPENSLDLGDNNLRILVTSRDLDARKHLPFPPGNIQEYPVKELDDDSSVRVLTQRIGLTSPEQLQFEGELDKIAEVARLCKGIPILLTAIGTDLKFNREKHNYYDITIQRLEEADFSNYRSERVEEILGSVLDSLSEHGKRTFLDICMFFVEGRWDFACCCFGVEVMEYLTERLLIQRPDKDSGTVTVHDIYRSISLKRSKREKSYFSLDSSNLGEGDDGCVELKDVSEDEDLSLEKLQGLSISLADDRNISLDPHILRSLRLFQIAKAKLEVKNKNGKAFQKLEYFTAEESDVTNIHMMLMKKGKRSSSLKVLSLERCSNLSGLLDGIDKLQSLQILHLRRCTSISPQVPFRKLPSAVSNLPNLRKLLLPGCNRIEVLPDNLGDLNSLEELDLSGTGIQNLPSSISDLQYLKKLDMSGCDGIQSLPNEMGMLSSLEYLDLSYCDKLGKLPSVLSGMISLKFLNMEWCTSIKELSNDLGKLTSLEQLNLSACRSLENLPSSISGLRNLKELKMSSCSTIELLPNEIGMLKSLEKLDMNYCGAIEALPDDLGKLGSLKVLSLSGCSNLQKLPSNMSELHSLEKLDMSWCRKVECLPDDFGMLPCLEDLNLTRCSSLKTLPSNIAGLKRLEKLVIDECEVLEYLPEDIGELPRLKVLNMDNCCSLKGLPSSLQKLDRLEVLTLNETKTMEILPPVVCELHSLKKLSLNSCSNLKELPSAFEGLIQLEELRMDYCEALEKLPELGKLSSLKFICLEGCTNLTSLPPSIVELQNLEKLDIRYCTAIENAIDIVGKLQCQVLPDYIGKLETVEELDISFSRIRKFPYKISDLQSLKKLDMSGCDGIQSLPNEMGMLTSLESLDISDCDKLEILPSGLCGMISLKTLNMSSCTSIKELPNGLGKLTSLEELNLSSCNSLKSLPSSISELQFLKKLNLFCCSAIQTLPDEIGMLPCLEDLNLTGCSNLKTLPSNIAGLKCLEKLELDDCEVLEYLPEDIGELPCLKFLYMDNCSSLKSIPSSLKKLECLEILTLNGWKTMETLPEFVCELHSLKELWLYNCSMLKELPPAVEELFHLEKLGMNHCKALEKLPELGKLSSLRCIYLEGCSNLKSLPLSIVGLENLEALDISYCKAIQNASEIVEKLKCKVLQATAEDHEEDENGEEDKQGAIDEPEATLMDEGNLQEEVQKE